MKKFETIAINGDALKTALSKRGYTLASASTLIFKSSGYFSVTTREGKMDKADYTLLQLLLSTRGQGFSKEEIDAIEMNEPDPPKDFYITLTKQPDRVVATLFEDGTPTITRIGRLFGDTMEDYIQAVSWATTLLWKATTKEE